MDEKYRCSEKNSFGEPCKNYAANGICVSHQKKKMADEAKTQKTENTSTTE